MTKNKIKNIGITAMQKLCKKHKLEQLIKDASDVGTAMNLIKTVAPNGEGVLEETVAKYIEKLNKDSPNIEPSENSLSIEELQKFCEERELISKVNSAITDKEAMNLINAALSKEKDFNDETIIAYRKLLINPPTVIDESVQELQRFCEENELKDEVKEVSTDNEAMNLIKIKFPEGKDFGLETVKSYRELLINPPTIPDNSVQELQRFCKKKLEDEVKEATDDEAIKLIKNTFYKGRVIDIKIVKTYRQLLKESDLTSGVSQGIKDAMVVSKQNAISLEALKKEIKLLNDTLNLLKVENEGLKQKSPTQDNTIKDKLMFQIRNLNELFNSNDDKINVSINKELLVKATKFVDANSLISLENIIKNGYDLNSTIVQSILFAFIHQNSLL